MTDSPWTIRPAELPDIAQIFALIIELADYERSTDQVVSTPARLTESLFPAEHAPALWGHVVVETETDRIIGMALWFLNYSTWEGKHGIYVEDLYLRPDARGHGLGKRLLATVAQICVEREYNRLELSVLNWNTPSIGFYEKCGGVALTDWTGYRFEPDQVAALA